LGLTVGRIASAGLLALGGRAASGAAGTIGPSATGATGSVIHALACGRTTCRIASAVLLSL